MVVADWSLKVETENLGLEACRVFLIVAYDTIDWPTMGV